MIVLGIYVTDLSNDLRHYDRQQVRLSPFGFFGIPRSLIRCIHGALNESFDTYSWVHSRATKILPPGNRFYACFFFLFFLFFLSMCVFFFFGFFCLGSWRWPKVLLKICWLLTVTTNPLYSLLPNPRSSCPYPYSSSPTQRLNFSCHFYCFSAALPSQKTKRNQAKAPVQVQYAH